MKLETVINIEKPIDRRLRNLPVPPKTGRGRVCKVKESLLTLERLKECLSYDPETGVFTRLVSKGRGKAGTEAGVVDSNGYRIICVEGMNFKAHRLAWYYFYGKWPEGVVDHENHIRDDNRIRNLKDVTQAQNTAKGKNHRGTQGVFGVPGVRIGGGSRDQITTRIVINGVTTHLGCFEDIASAYEAYRQAKIKHYSVELPAFEHFGVQNLSRKEAVEIDKLSRLERGNSND